MPTLVPGRTLCSSRAQLQGRQQPAIAMACGRAQQSAGLLTASAPLRAGAHTNCSTALGMAFWSLRMGRHQMARLLPPRAEARDAAAGAAGSEAEVSRLTDSDAMGAEAFVDGAQPAAASPVRPVASRERVKVQSCRVALHSLDPHIHAAGNPGRTPLPPCSTAHSYRYPPPHVGPRVRPTMASMLATRAEG